MLTLFLMAGLLSVALLGVAVLSVLVGCLLLAVGHPTWRALAPYVLLVPSLGSLVALAGAWGCGATLVRLAGESPLPFWGWLGGLVVGGVLGSGAGISAAYCLGRRTSAA